MQIPDSIPVSKIKVRIPFRRRELISRTRLIESLYDQFDNQLLLIVAPAGYGKTSLLVDLAQDSEIPVCWLSLDALDQDPQRFLAYLIAAIAERFPEFGKDSLPALQSLTSFEQDGERMLVTLTNELAAKINEHFAVVLDDYHLVGDVLIIRQLVSRFLQLAGEKVHLILAARNLPDIPDMPALVMKNSVGGLSFDDLAFKTDEIQQLFSEKFSKQLSEQDAMLLVQETEGWIAAIQLQGGNAEIKPPYKPLKSTRELFDFFSQEILRNQPEDVKRFLLMTSYFDTFDVTLCEQVLSPLVGEETPLDWESLFATVQSGGLFSFPIDDAGLWMRYHNLFQHFLRSKIQYENPTLAWHIQQNLARVYEQQQAWDEALQIYDILKDHASFGRLLGEIGSIFIRNGRLLTLENWLSKLPDETIYSQPELLSLLGVVHATRGERAQAIELYNLADEKFSNSDNSFQLAINLSRRAEAYRQQAYYELALADVERIFELTKNTENLSLKHIFAEAQRSKGLSNFAVGNIQQALIWLKKSLQTCREIGLDSHIPILETELGVVYRRLGKPEITAKYYASALGALENTGNTGWKARLYNNLALLYHLTGKLKEALPLLENALTTAERSGHVWYQTNISISLGDFWADVGELAIAHEYYDKALTLATNLGDSLLVFYASIGEARLKQLNGEISLALRAYEQVELAHPKLGLYENALLKTAKGSCLLQNNRDGEAVITLQEAVKSLDLGQTPMERANARLWLAAARSKTDSYAAITEMEEILPDPELWKKPTPLMINAGRVGKWLDGKEIFPFEKPNIREFFKEAKAIQNGLPRLSATIREASQHAPNVPLNLEIFTFGNVRVKQDDYELLLSDWQTREARELFFFLLHSKPMTKEQIALEFWPDISPARLKMRFKISIHRIRKALGQDVVVFSGERYYFNKAVKYTWDRETFDELIKKASDSPRKISLLESAANLVTGPYLADIDGDWVLPHRLVYQDLYQNLMLTLAEHYLSEGRAQDALQAARQLLQSEPLLEAAHSLIIRAYASLKDSASMVRQYQEYQQALVDELGLQPSSEFQLLFGELIQKI